MTAHDWTPRGRLLAAMRCEVPDRVPIQVRGVYPTRADSENRHPSHRPLFELVRDKCDPVHPFDMRSGWYGIDPASLDRKVETVPFDEDWVEDLVTIGTPRGELTESFRRSLKGDPGFRMTHLIETEEDAERFLSIAVVSPEPDAAGFLETCGTVGERALVIADVGSDPVGMLHNLVGSETLAMWSLTARDLVRRMLAEFQKRTLAFVAKALDAGVGPVFGTLGHEVALPPLLSPADFREFVVEVERPVMDMIHARGCIVHVHCHYNLRKVIGGFVELGINCLHPVEAPPMGDIELAEAKRILAGTTCIEGNIQIGLLQDGTPEEVRRVTRDIIEDAAAGGGLILAPTASPFWPTLCDRTLANYRAFIETGLEFGRY